MDRERNTNVRVVLEQGFYMISGSLLYAIAINMIITPLGFYSGGSTGIIQLIRTFLLDVVHVQMPKGIDLTGIINMTINIPLLFIAYRVMGKAFFLKTMISVVTLSFWWTIVPVPAEMIITDYLTACLVGGILAGIGAGLLLRGKSSGGGTDIIGVCLSKKYPNFSVGRNSLMINIVLFSIYLILFDIETVIYSFIYVAIYAFTLDRVHIQNVKMSLLIFTKKSGIPKKIMEQMRRGVTKWEGVGAYTNENTEILCVVVSKYEIPQIKKIVHSVDPDAFSIIMEGCSIDGNFEKRL